MAEGCDVGEKFLDDLKANLGMGHFAAAKFQSHFYLHVLAEKVDGVPDLNAQVMRIDLGAELNFLNFVGVLMLPGFLVALGLFIAELAKINQAADRWHRVGRDLD